MPNAIGSGRWNQRPRPRRAIRWLVASTLLAFFATLGLALPFDPAQTPAVPVPPERYASGELRPRNILGDTTNINANNTETADHAYYWGVTAEGNAVDGYALFAATGAGLEIWDVTNADQPLHRSFTDARDAFPLWGHADTDHRVRAVDAPDGRHDVLAMGATTEGLVIWDTTNLSSPRVHYQDNGTSKVPQLWAFTADDGTMYVVTADNADGVNGGIKLYDLSRARAYVRCLENSGAAINCPGVYLGLIGGRKVVTSLHGTAVANRRFAAARWQVGQSYRVQVWDLTTPLDALDPTAVPRLDATFPAGLEVNRIVIWSENGRYLLGALGEHEVAIFDVTCIAGDGACSLGPAVATVPTPAEVDFDNRQEELSFGRADGQPFLYVGNIGAGLDCRPQREYLLDVSLPIDPARADITPAPITDATHPDGPLLGYWGWYGCSCTTGFNFVRPQRATFHPAPDTRLLYRAAFSLLDSHEITTPLTSFSDGFESGDASAWSQAVGLGR